MRLYQGLGLRLLYALAWSKSQLDIRETADWHCYTPTQFGLGKAEILKVRVHQYLLDIMVQVFQELFTSTMQGWYIKIILQF